MIATTKPIMVATEKLISTSYSVTPIWVNKVLSWNNWYVVSITSVGDEDKKVLISSNLDSNSQATKKQIIINNLKKKIILFSVLCFF